MDRGAIRSTTKRNTLLSPPALGEHKPQRGASLEPNLNFNMPQTKGVDTSVEGSMLGGDVNASALSQKLNKFKNAIKRGSPTA